VLSGWVVEGAMAEVERRNEKDLTSNLNGDANSQKKLSKKEDQLDEVCPAVTRE